MVPVCQGFIGKEIFLVPLRELALPIFSQFRVIHSTVILPAATNIASNYFSYSVCTTIVTTQNRFSLNYTHNIITMSSDNDFKPFELPKGEGKKVCVGGGAGFIGSHIAKRLKEAGWYVICVDWKTNEFMKNDEFCNEFIHDDLRKLEVACKACEGCTQVYNLAADMGGMGFIVSNESVLSFNNTAISMNMLEAARRNNVKDFFYSSSACVYNEAKQEDPANPGLIESDARSP